MVLQFQIVAVRTKQVPHGQGVGLGPLVVPGQQQPGELAARQADGAMIPSWYRVSSSSPPGACRKTLREARLTRAERFRYPCSFRHKEDQVIGAVVHLMDPVEAGPGAT